MTTVARKQIPLSKNRAEAKTLSHKLTASDESAKTLVCPFPVRKLCDTDLDRAAGYRGERLRSRVLDLRRFCNAFGRRRLESLKPHKVNDWLDGLMALMAGRNPRPFPVRARR